MTMAASGFTSYGTKWLASETRRTRRVEQAMGDVIKNRATMLAPELTGALKKSGRVVTNPQGGVSVIFGGDDVGVPYARRRHFENRKNPQTLRYLEKAGNSVKKENIKKYYDMSK